MMAMEQCVPLLIDGRIEEIIGFVAHVPAFCGEEYMSQKMNKKLTRTSPNRIDIRVALMIADIGEYYLLILQVTTNTGHMWVAGIRA